MLGLGDLAEMDVLMVLEVIVESYLVCPIYLYIYTVWKVFHYITNSGLWWIDLEYYKWYSTYAA